MWGWLRGFRDVAMVLVWLPGFIAFIVIPSLALEAYRLSLPGNRRAIRLARATFLAEHSESVIASDRIVQMNRQRCYVVVTPRCGFIPPVSTLYAVWYSTGEVREVETTQFHWGITPKPFIRDFEQSLGGTQP
jgi:hypothetical protein